MNNSAVHTTTPEEDELEKKLVQVATLSIELVQRELDLSNLQAELRVFEQRYVKVVGVRMAMLDDIKARIAEVTAEIYKSDQKVFSDATRARAQADESARTVDFVSKSPEPNDKGRNDKLKTLYREAAKLIHPDLASDERDNKHRTEWMFEVNEAYRMGDENRLRKILLEWSSSPESIVGNDVGSKLIRAIRQVHRIRTRLSEIDLAINLHTHSELYLLKIEVEHAQNDGRDILQEMVLLLAACRREASLAG